jgi:hypothetical protein
VQLEESCSSSLKLGVLGVCTAFLMLFLVMSFLGEGSAEHSGDGEVFRGVQTVTAYRGSGDVPYWEAEASAKKKSRWTPSEIVGLLQAYPDYYVDMGFRSSPTGDVYQQEMGRIVNETQALAKAQGVDASRLMIHFRSDVLQKFAKGWWSCTLCETPENCTDLCTWEGTMKNAPFDPSWIMRVPRAEHLWAVNQIWGGDPSKDPWNPSGAHLWARHVDRGAIEQVNTETHVAALYGPVRDRDTSVTGVSYAFGVSRVLMDLRNPDYRAWSVKKLIADLKVKGIDPGEHAAVMYAYKPGWHTYYDGRNPTHRCFVEGSHMWAGPAGPCRGVRPPGGPFTRTPYGPGEFESALNAMLLEMRAGLVAAGLENVLIATVERPDFMDKKWSILAPSIRNAPWLAGNLVSSCDRTRLSVPANPVTCRSRGSADSPVPKR